MFSSHILKLNGIYRYIAPKGRKHSPRSIKPNHEEVEIIVAGRGYFIEESKSVDVGPGGILWYYPKEIVEVVSHCKEPYNAIVFDFCVRNDVPEHRPRITYWEDRLECARFCKEALDRFVTHNFCSPYFVHCLYARFFWESMRINQNIDEVFSDKTSKALVYIEEKYLSQISLVDISKAAEISIPYLHQLFKKELQTSPFKYIMNKRITRAKYLLKSTDIPIKNIAFESGFSDYNNFCRMFRIKTGHTPTEFRIS